MTQNYIFGFDSILADVRKVNNQLVYTDEPIDGMREALAQLREQDKQIIVACNYASCAWKVFNPNPYKNYQSVRDACNRLLRVAIDLSIKQAPFYIATWDEKIWDILIKRIDWERDDVKEQQLTIIIEVQEKMKKINDAFAYCFEQVGMKAIARSIPDWRLPETEMLETILLQEHCTLEETVLVGYEKSPEQKAAEKLELAFMTRTDFQNKLQRGLLV